MGWILLICELMPISIYFGEPAPTGPFDLTGIGGQFDQNAPLDGGYQVLPRKIADISPILSVENLAAAYTVELSPNPASEQVLVSSNVRIESARLINAVGQEMGYWTPRSASFSIDLPEVMPGYYQLVFLHEAAVWSEALIIR